MNILFTNPMTGDSSNTLYQWDQGVPMSVTLANATEAEAVFAPVGKKEEGIRRTLTKSSDGKWTCSVPDAVLTHGLNVNIYFTYTSAGRRTVDHAEVVVIPQPKPEGYISTDDPEYVSLNELMDKVLGLGGSMMTKEEIDRIFE